MKSFTPNTLLRTYLPIVAFALALPTAVFDPTNAIASESKPVNVVNFPALQTTQTADQPFVLVGTAHVEIGEFLGSVDSFGVPPGMALILDGATAEIQQSITSTGITVQMRLNITFPGEPGTTVATEPKPVNLMVGASGYISNPASWTLPPMHLPPGTYVQVSLIQTESVFALDYNVFVTGHLVPAVADE